MSVSVCVFLCACVCLSVCLSASMSLELQVQSHQFFLHVTYGRGSTILLWRHCDTSYTSGFVYDVNLSHNGLYVDTVVATPLLRSVINGLTRRPPPAAWQLIDSVTHDAICHTTKQIRRAQGDDDGGAVNKSK